MFPNKFGGQAVLALACEDFEPSQQVVKWLLYSHNKKNTIHNHKNIKKNQQTTRKNDHTNIGHTHAVQARWFTILQKLLLSFAHPLPPPYPHEFFHPNSMCFQCFSVITAYVFLLTLPSTPHNSFQFDYDYFFLHLFPLCVQRGTSAITPWLVVGCYPPTTNINRQGIRYTKHCLLQTFPIPHDLCLSHHIFFRKKKSNVFFATTFLNMSTTHLAIFFSSADFAM